MTGEARTNRAREINFEAQIGCKTHYLADWVRFEPHQADEADNYMKEEKRADGEQQGSVSTLNIKER